MPIAAGPVANAAMAAVIALLDLAAESRRATHFDCRHHASLRGRHGCAILVSPGTAVTAEDVRHLELRTIHERWRSELPGCGLFGSDANRRWQQIERTGGGT